MCASVRFVDAGQHQTELPPAQRHDLPRRRTYGERRVGHNKCVDEAEGRQVPVLRQFFREHRSQDRDGSRVSGLFHHSDHSLLFDLFNDIPRVCPSPGVGRARWAEYYSPSGHDCVSAADVRAHAFLWPAPVGTVLLLHHSRDRRLDRDHDGHPKLLPSQGPENAHMAENRDFGLAGAARVSQERHSEPLGGREEDVATSQEKAT